VEDFYVLHKICYSLGMGVLYLFTCGLFFIGVIIDIINLISKPEYYKV